MNFDVTITIKNSIDYGIFYGNEKIVFIKSGRCGSHRGYDDKYVKMARHLHSNHGYTVICSSNPIEYDKTYDTDKIVVERVVAEKGFADFEVYLIGSSNGAYQNLFLANQLSQVKKLLCINMPLMLNFHKATRELQAMDMVEKTFVYGTEDPSYWYIPMLEMRNYPLLRVIRVQGADHQFTDKIDAFIALADLI